MLDIRDIHGNIRGLKPSQKKRLEATYRRRVPPEAIVSPELARHLCELSRELGRQLGVLIDRRGAVERVIVGDAHQIELPEIGRARAGQVRLRGLRLVHTHLEPGEPDRDDLTDLALLRLDLVAVIHAGPQGLPGTMAWAQLLPDNPAGELWRIETRRSVQESLGWAADAEIQALEDQLASSARRLRKVEGRERAILVGICSQRRHEGQARLTELGELARTAGVEVVDSLLQMKRRIDPKTLIGRGKLEELNLRAMQQMVEVIIFDRDLAPSQARNIAEVTSVKILDRSQLILDIFAQRAQSNEGKIQVELAQLRYTMPRLKARDDSLSRLTGGIGSRGPGETKLQVDRRRVRDRIARLETQLETIATSREVQRARRSNRAVPSVAIVGYTNAGKSTLLRALTKSDVLVENKLFATLDTASRRLRFPQEREVVMVDTVGFVRDLPRELEAAFRATLEEIGDADLLLHIVDVSDDEHPGQIEAVEHLLASIPGGDGPRLLVFNKADRIPKEKAAAIARRHEGVAISALSRDGLRALLDRAGAVLFRESPAPRAQVALTDLP